MPRLLAGIDLTELIGEAFEDVFEDDLALLRGSTEFACAGFFERLGNGSSRVYLLAEVEELGAIRPVQGDRIRFEDQIMRVEAVGGLDGVIWECQCSPAVDETGKAAAPTLTLNKLSNNNVKAQIEEAIPSGAFLKTRVRRGGSPFWFNDLYSKSRSRTIRLPGAGAYEVGASFIAADGSASVEAIEVLPEAA